MPFRFRTANNQLPVIGDDVPVEVTITDWPAGVTIQKAWLTFKEKALDTAPIFLQKTLTSGFVIAGGTAVFTFDLTNTDTLLFKPNLPLSPKLYYVEVQLLESTGRIKTPQSAEPVEWKVQLNTSTS